MEELFHVESTPEIVNGEPEKPVRILVAEDEASIRNICCRVLKSAGYEVYPAAHGGEALQILSERGHELDLIVADVVMPVAGAKEILESLRELGLVIPVIFASGYAMRSGPADFLDSDGVRLLRKPYTLAQLLETVRDALPPPDVSGEPSGVGKTPTAS